MFLSTLIAAISRHLNHRKAMRDLSGLEDYQLADPGVGRSEIAAVVQYGR